MMMPMLKPSLMMTMLMTSAPLMKKMNLMMMTNKMMTKKLPLVLLTHHQCQEG